MKVSMRAMLAIGFPILVLSGLTAPVTFTAQKVLAQAPSNAPNIRESYRTAFGRDPQAGELQYWEGRGRLSAQDLVTQHRQYVKSDEGTRRDMINRAYQEVFKRPPSGDEINFWNQSLRSNGYTYTEMVNTHRQFLAANPPASAQDITSAYRTAFGRDPQQSELTYWQGQGALRADQIIARHRDYIKSDDGTRRDMINRAYQEVFKRPPNGDELNSWNQSLRNNGYTYVEMVNQHRQFLAANPPASSQDITTSYRTAFGRDPQGSEVTYWQGQGTLRSDQMIARHREHIKGDEATRRDMITRMYKEVLNRSPNSEEMDYWNDSLRSGGTTYADLVRTTQSNPYIPGQCKDARITRAYREVTDEANGRSRAPKGVGETGECDPALYFGYSSYGDLKNKVRVKTSQRGVAYIFIIPTQAALQGHIGWGYQRDDGKYIAGSTENPFNLGNIGNTFVMSKDQDNKAWVTQPFDTEKEMLDHMARGKYLGGYTEYKKTMVMRRNASAALKEGKNNMEMGFGGIANNCLDATYRVLEAYGAESPNVMQWKQTHAAPNSWFRAFGFLKADGTPVKQDDVKGDPTTKLSTN